MIIIGGACCIPSGVRGEQVEVDAMSSAAPGGMY